MKTMAGDSPDKTINLYGDLELHIIQARHLPNMDLTSERLRRLFAVCDCSTAPPTIDGEPIESEESHRSHRSHRSHKDRDMKIDSHHKGITSDPYVTVEAPHCTLARTRVVSNSTNPKWDERFFLNLAHPADILEFRVKDNDLLGAQLIGTVRIPAEKVATAKQISGWFPILGTNGKPPKPDSALKLELKFIPFDENPTYKHGIPDDPEEKGVQRAYFPIRSGNLVTLYQDAHGKHDGKVPKFELDDGMVFERQDCWEDMCHAIVEAHHLVYIAGWSVFHKIKLIREPTKPLPRGGDLTLGELLKYKSEEGVRVLLLVWDDKTSHDKLFIKMAGVMQTHDEETRKFFKHSSVICVLSPRYASGKLGILKQQVVGNVFTHHQKCVLVDTQAYGNNRKVTAFVGGLDLCDGRYDTPEHRLFRDIDTVFKDDFHQPTYPPGIKAPRQPWHDLHSRIEGPAAYDVLINFAQRWRKATKWREFAFLKKKISRWHDDAMIKLERISWILSPALEISERHTIIPGDDPKLHVTKDNDPHNWHVQIFRSIDSGSLKGFPKYYDGAEAQNLIWSKKLVIERSIQTAYVLAIRSAQHFIYIENQYFLGSSYAWSSNKDAGADHQIPIELALKIASKIRAKERFAVYVIVPMWPEGDPKTATVQEILFWQSRTMQMMYRIIADELKSFKAEDVHPLEYLNFYCLGKRESIPDLDSQPAGDTDSNKVCESMKYQRFMIYVHAKGMIVDDEYVIIGSANINQRSMAGSKDTEIAMGAYQPHYTWGKKNRHPYGQIHGYRMSLWEEHLGGLEKSYLEPNKLECVKRVNEVAEDNWKRFTAEEFSELQGHLMKYPIEVDSDGNVGPLPGNENFPDVGGKVLGCFSAAIPDILTT